MKVLVTGAHGLVGRNLLSHSAAADFSVAAPQRSVLDLLDADGVETYLRAQMPDLIIHAAGIVGGIKANIESPVQFFHSNLVMGVNLLMAAKSVGVPRIINLGSTCMYPRDAQNPLCEDDILTGKLEPTNEGYALAKISVQRLGAYLSEQIEGISVKTVVPCNLYGPHDKFDDINAHLVPALLRKLHLAKVNGEQTVTIWGDGSARREFMYVGDLAEFLWQACARFSDLPALVNVGVGHDHTITEYYQTSAEVVGFSGQFVYDTSQPSGMQQKLADSRLASEFGWHSRTSLIDGLTITYDYFRGIVE